MRIFPRRSCSPRLPAFIYGMLAVAPLPAEELRGLLPAVWSLAEQRSDETVLWMDATIGQPLMHTRYPTLGNNATGRWNLATNLRDWRDGFWPGILWLIAQRTGSATWRQRATDWTLPLLASDNIDHDIGFIVLSSLGKGLLYHDELTDPGDVFRGSAKAAILDAAGKLDARFNKPNTLGDPVPAGLTRSWNPPFQNPYPVCVDNLMNLEVMFLAYELNGCQPSQRVWFDHALEHARTTMARHLRADGGTYHVVKHFETGPQIGAVERKSTWQGFAAESTWSRGQAWAIYGFTMVHRHASRDPGTDASDVLAAAQASADYFLARLPHAFTADAYNHRAGDFVPPSDFDASLGEPLGPWNDANLDYNPVSATGLGDRKAATLSFTLRDSSAAAIAASGLIELSGVAATAEDRTRYFQAAEKILCCLIRYDGPDADAAPDYLCSSGETAAPGILKLGCHRWGDQNQALIYGDYYFLEALARYEALAARKLLAETKRIGHDNGVGVLEFELDDPAPALTFHIQRSPDLSEGSWIPIASRIGAGQWAGEPDCQTDPLPGDRVRVRITDPTPGAQGFFRVRTRSVGGGF
jgi:unsaturated chondroitin disaccharide hydrolase